MSGKMSDQEKDLKTAIQRFQLVENFDAYKAGVSKILKKATKMSDPYAARDIVVKIIEDVKKINGVCVLNFHPILIERNFNCYQKILEFLNKQTDILVATGSELVGLMNKRRLEADRLY